MRATFLLPPPRAAALPLLLAVTLLAGCQHDATAPAAPPATRLAPALIEVTISGIGGPEMRAVAAPPGHPAFSTGGFSASLSRPMNSDSGGTGAIQLKPLATGSFTTGEREAGGARYVWTIFRVRNAQVDGTAYDTPRQNLTFFAAATGSTMGGSAISTLRRFDGSAADPSIAPQVLPTGSVYQQNDLVLPNQPDVLQVIEESEAAAIDAPAGVDVLPYGFAVRNATDRGRTLAASPAEEQYDGIVTFAFKVPLQSSAAADPFTMSAIFLAVDDSETRITQSLEEQTPAGAAAFLARAQAIGATMKTVLPGPGSYGGDPSDTRLVCTVRSAGPSASPTAYLGYRPVASVGFATSFTDWPLWAGGSVARDLRAEARDADGNPIPEVPVDVSVGTPGVVVTGSNGLEYLVPRRDRASTTMSASACGHTLSSTLRTSGFSPIDAAAWHSLAIRNDGSVAAWGDNASGERDVPPELTDVVQVAAGRNHSLALRADGTVVAWGAIGGEGRTSMPPGLSNVVQIAAGEAHSLALKSDGTVVAWGANYFGQRDVPEGLTGVVQISAGHDYSLALRSDGTVVSWSVGLSAAVPKPANLTDVVQVAGGRSHALALKADGTVVGWGTDNQGKAIVPPGLRDVVQIAAGEDQSLALKKDGTVVAWGDGYRGATSVPPGLKDVVQIAAGNYHSLAVKKDGTVVVWGGHAAVRAVPGGLVATVP